MKKPLGLVVIRKRDAKKILAPLAIEDFFGIGKKTAPHLRELGINTIGDLIKRIDEEDPVIKEVLGKFYFVISDWINGKGDDEINTEPFDPKSIGHSTTLFSDALSVEELEKPLRELSEEVARDAQKRGKKGKTVQLVLKDNEFKVINRSRRLGQLSNSFDDIFKTALELLKENYNGKPTRLIGVTLQQLQNPKETYEQLSIFDNYEQIKEENETRLLIGDLNRQMHKSVFKTAADHLRESGNDTKRGR
jgi:DNA polymerase-4